MLPIGPNADLDQQSEPRAAPTGAHDLPSDAFDCVVLTQVLQLVYDEPVAMRALHRVLRPGGVLLATALGISNIDPDGWGPTW